MINIHPTCNQILLTHTIAIQRSLKIESLLKEDHHQILQIQKLLRKRLKIVIDKKFRVQVTDKWHQNVERTI